MGAQGEPDQFSPCSVELMKTLFNGERDGLERKCVYQKPCDVYSNWSPELQGEMFTEDEYCMYKYGSQYTNANGIFCNAKDACKYLVCGRDPANYSKKNCKSFKTERNGLACGDNMYCMHGQCVAKPDTATFTCTSEEMTFSVPSNCVDDAD